MNETSTDGPKEQRGPSQELIRWLQALFYDSPAAIGFSRDGAMLDANPAYLELFGLRRDELRGGSLLDNIAPSHRAEIIRRIQTRAAGGQVPTTYETRGRRTDGTEFPFEITTGRVSVDDGPLTIAFITDISERVRVRTELTEALELNLRVLNASTMSCLVYLAEGPCIFANVVSGPMIGASQEQVASQNFRQLVSWKECGMLASADCALETGVDQRGLFHLTTSFGREIWIDCQFSRVIRAGRPLLFAFMHDATTERKAELARREADERLGRALAAVNDAVWEWNLHTGATFVSPRGHDLLDYSPGVEIGPLNEWPRQLAAEDRAPFDQVLADYREGTRDAHQLELRVQGASGLQRWVLFRGRLLGRDDAGRPVRVVGTLADIDAQKRDAEEQRLLAERVRHAQKLESLGMLAGGIAHDFNNLLTTILGSTELALSEGHVDPTLKGHLDTIGLGARRAAELCAQMLAYAGKTPLATRPVDLGELILGMGQLLDASVSQKATLVRELAAGTPAIVADPTQLRQVLLNLVINAAEALGDSQGVIRVATGAGPCPNVPPPGSPLPAELPRGECAWFEVEDSGCGMAPETIAQMCEPFFTTKFAGRGLGMAAVQGIVRSHGGLMVVSSAPGRGTRTRVYFPARGQLPAAAAPAPAVGFRGQGVILLVDDQRAVRVTTRMLIETFGFEVLEASGGKEAIALYRAERERIVAVLLDLTMPGMNGTEVLSALRQIDPTVRVVLTTGFSTEAMVAASASEPPDGVLGKPFTLSQLSDALRLVTSVKN